jgi:hypothetical protein
VEFSQRQVLIEDLLVFAIVLIREYLLRMSRMSYGRCEWLVGYGLRSTMGWGLIGPEYGFAELAHTATNQRERV